MNERALLTRLIQGPASGAEIARAAGQTRAAVSKQIQALRAGGVAIDVRPGHGYTLAQPLELLDAGEISARLPPDCRAQIASVEVAWSLGSTNSELLRRPAPADGVVVLLAERQSGGRGRRGRKWVSPLAANLYLSLSRTFDGGLARLPGLSLAAGVATAEALHELGFTGVRVKWPNDVVIVEDAGAGTTMRKLGGLLVEGGGEVAGPARVVLGLGLNVAMPGPAATQIGQPWIDLATLAGGPNGAGVPPSRNVLTAKLLAHWLPALAQFQAYGLAPLLPRYARLDALAGREVRLHENGRVHLAHALGLAADGALRLRIDGVERQIHAGDVSTGEVSAGEINATETSGEVSVRGS